MNVSGINSHWLEYGHVSEGTSFMLAIYYILIMVVGLFLNITLLLLILSSPSLRKPVNILVLNIIICDIIMYLSAQFIIINNLNHGPALGQTSCIVYSYLCGLSGIGHILTSCAIAFLRQKAIAQPLPPQPKLSWRRAWGWISFIWVLSACLAGAPLTGIMGRFSPDGYLSSCSWDYLDVSVRGYIWASVVLLWAVPLAVLMICYYRIRHAATGLGPSHIGQEEEAIRNQKRLTGVIFVLIVAWLVQWTPYALIALLGSTGYSKIITPFVGMLPSLLCKTAACANPFVYGFCHSRYRQELSRIIDRCNIFRTNIEVQEVELVQPSLVRTLETAQHVRHVEEPV